MVLISRSPNFATTRSVITTSSTMRLLLGGFEDQFYLIGRIPAHETVVGPCPESAYANSARKFSILRLLFRSPTIGILASQVRRKGTNKIGQLVGVTEAKKRGMISAIHSMSSVAVSGNVRITAKDEDKGRVRVGTGMSPRQIWRPNLRPLGEVCLAAGRSLLEEQCRALLNIWHGRCMTMSWLCIWAWTCCVSHKLLA